MVSPKGRTAGMGRNGIPDFERNGGLSFLAEARRRMS